MSFGINDRSDAEALAAAVDGVADVEKWLELQVFDPHPCCSAAKLQVHLFPDRVYGLPLLRQHQRCNLSRPRALARPGHIPSTTTSTTTTTTTTTTHRMNRQRHARYVTEN
jgi:hypothetical protein